MSHPHQSTLGDTLIAKAIAEAGPPPTDEELFAYVDGTLDEQDIERVRRHLVGSADGRERLEEIRSFADAAQKVKSGALPFSRLAGRDASQHELDRQQNLDAHASSSRFNRYSGGLIAAMLIAGIGAFLFLRTALSPETAAPVRAVTGLELIEGLRSSPPTVELEPGGELHLSLLIPDPPAECSELGMQIDAAGESFRLDNLKLDQSNRLSLVVLGKPGLWTLKLEGCGEQPRKLSFRILEPPNP